MERSRRSSAETGQLIGTGHAALDGVLPDGGLRRGMLFEWINEEGPGSGAVTLALLAAGGLLREESDESGGLGTLAVVDRGGGFYTAAAAALGVSSERTLVVRPETTSEWMWAVEQVLRSPSVDVVLTWAGRLDHRIFRRWQLAAELGGGVGMLVRTPDVVRDSSWAAARVMVRGDGEGDADVRTGGRRWGVRVLRGGVGGRTGRVGGDEGEVLLELDDETGGLYLLSRLECAEPVGVSASG